MFHDARRGEGRGRGRPLLAGVPRRSGQPRRGISVHVLSGGKRRKRGMRETGNERKKKRRKKKKKKKKERKKGRSRYRRVTRSRAPLAYPPNLSLPLLLPTSLTSPATSRMRTGVPQ